MSTRLNLIHVGWSLEWKRRNLKSLSLLKNVAFALSAFAHLGLKLASLDVVELLQPPPRRQYAVEQILNAHSQIFLQHPFNVDFKGAAPF